MYVEFTLPTGAGGMAAGYTHYALRRELKKWSEKYDIEFHEKVVKYRVKVTFNDPEHYTFFALTWVPNNSNSFINRFELIEPMS